MRIIVIGTSHTNGLSQLSCEVDSSSPFTDGEAEMGKGKIASRDCIVRVVLSPGKSAPDAAHSRTAQDHLVKNSVQGAGDRIEPSHLLLVEVSFIFQCEDIEY